jgi:hypothetical protein
MFFEIKANGRFIDEVYYARPKTIDEVKKEYQKLLKTENVKVRRMISKG